MEQTFWNGFLFRNWAQIKYLQKREIEFMQSFKRVFTTLAGVAAGILVLAPAAKAATNVVLCTPTLGQTAVAVLGSGCDEFESSGSLNACARTCVGGPDAGDACDVDADCGMGGTCTGAATAASEADGLNPTTAGLTKITLKTSVFDNCVTNAAEITGWGAIVGGAKQTGIKDAAAATAINTLTKATASIKAQTYGTCNFSVPVSDAYSAHGKGEVKWLNASNSTVAKTKFYGRVAGDLTTTSANDTGVVLKGLGIGGEIFASLGFDLGAAGNTPILGCNGLGPMPTSPVPAIFLTTNPPGVSTLSIDFP